MQPKGSQPSARCRGRTEQAGKISKNELPNTPNNPQVLDEVKLLWLNQLKAANLSRPGRKLSTRTPFSVKVDWSISKKKGFVVDLGGPNTITFSPEHPLGPRLLAFKAGRAEIEGRTPTDRSFVDEDGTSLGLLGNTILGVLVVCTLYGIWYWHTLEKEVVPISWRRRLKISLDLPDCRNEQEEFMPALRPSIVPSCNPDSVGVERVFARVIEASGLADREWQIHLIDKPFEYESRNDGTSSDTIFC